MNCPSCGYDKNRKAKVKKGKKRLFPRLNLDERQCTKCGGKWSIYDRNPKLLYMDIETSKITVEKRMEIWPGQLWNEFKFRPEDIVQDWFVMSWSAQWVCDNYMHSYVVRPTEAKKRNDKRILKPLWKLFDEADVIIGHNSDRFDIKKLNWRWMVHEYKPPKPYRQVDTMKEIAKIAAPTSKGLDYLTKTLQLNGKKKHDPDLFDRCMAGDVEALRELKEYNEVDVSEGQSLYMLIRPWMKHHPNMGLYYQDDVARCKNCGNTELDIDYQNLVYTSANAWACWTCSICGANGRTPESVRYESGWEGEDSESRKERVRDNRIMRETLMR